MVEAMSTAKSLQSMGYQVVAVASYGEEAIEKAHELKPDIILMDIILKGSMDGIDVARAISKLEIPVIYITAIPDDATINRALLSAPYGYLVKPLDDFKLKISIEVALYKKLMEDKLKQSQENYYQTIFENTGAANIIVEENKLISLVNTEFSSLTGYSKEETEGKMEWTQVFHQDDRERMEDYHRLRRINPNHAPRNYEAKLIGKDNLLVNHDRCAVYRPTLILGNEYKTKESLHLDIDPLKFQQNDKNIWKKVDSLKYNDVCDFLTENNHVTISARGKQYQAILNLVDNYEEDGGFIIVPGFHNYFENWLQTIKPNNNVECRYIFNSNDFPYIRVCCKEGSMVVWDQRCAHGSKPNKSANMRCVQFIKMFSSDHLANEQNKKRLSNRKKCIIDKLTKNNFVDNVSEIGEIVFGLK